MSSFVRSSLEVPAAACPHILLACSCICSVHGMQFQGSPATTCGCQHLMALHWVSYFPFCDPIHLSSVCLSHSSHSRFAGRANHAKHSRANFVCKLALHPSRLYLIFLEVFLSVNILLPKKEVQMTVGYVAWSLFKLHTSRLATCTN